MKKSILILFTIAYSFLNIQAQDEKANFGIKFSGFVKTDFFFDSRQTVNAREGHFLLWPAAESLDANGQDINAKSSFNFLSLQSRLSVNITGPDAFGAKTSGLIEGDFFAQANDNINLLRLRHAFVKLKWSNTELLTGQYWNPLFVTDCFPGTVSFNTGTPFQSFARNPQIRISHDIGDVKLLIAALAQRDFASRGPDPSNNNNTLISSDFLRNSTIPDLHFQVHYNLKNEESETNILLGTGLAYKTVVPRLFSSDGTNKYKVDEKLGGLTALGFTTITLKPATIKVMARYGENISDLLSISGFAIKEIEDPVTGEQSYTPLKNLSYWTDIQSNGKNIQVGIFGGYLKNMGTKEEMSAQTNNVYGLATNIESLFRISPRIMLISNKTKLACEVEYTSAAYGSAYDVNYIPANTTTVSNLRLLMSVIYSF
ncbi:MAG: hypothetical protein K9H49_11895 [Bacteroidales bacterium]|nr:hypothetical protein [Bacteroidales bacterium]MCF8390815.1 hypothetical protein [Bacteroidales bacterium]